MIKTVLVDPVDRTALKTEHFWRGPHQLDEAAKLLLITEPYRSHGVFKTLVFTGAGTTALVTPNDNGSLILTDLIITGDKVNNGSIEVKFINGTHEDTLIKPVVTDAPVALNIPFSGRFQGWKDARIDVVITGAVSGSVVIGYIKAPRGLPYNEWDALR